MERSCSQAHIAGPFILNLMIDKLLGELISAIECVVYGDGLLILVEGNS